MENIDLLFENFFDEIRDDFIRQSSWCDDGTFFLDNTECVFYYDENNSAEFFDYINELSRGLWN